MTGIVDWAAERARMVLAFIALTLLAGGLAYWGLPKRASRTLKSLLSSSLSPSPAFQRQTAKHCWSSQWKPSLRILTV